MGDKINEEQEARATLRESYLKSISELIGKKCTIVHYEKGTLDAVFSGMDSKGTEILVTDFQSPIAFYKSAMLRTTDVLSISIDTTS